MVGLETYECSECGETFYKELGLRGHSCDHDQKLHKAVHAEQFIIDVFPDIFRKLLASPSDQVSVKTRLFDSEINKRKLGHHFIAVERGQLSVPYIDVVETFEITSGNRYLIEQQVPQAILAGDECYYCDVTPDDESDAISHLTEHCLDRYTVQPA
jgi:hypothetical protein